MGNVYTKSGKLAKRLYFGAVLLFEGLYYTFKNRVLADGGTFLENELPTISQDASLVLTPNAYKAGKLYSAVPNDGTGDFTVDRNSTATYIDEDGLIKTALANEVRFDWSTGVPVILREPQSTNLSIQSNLFSSGSWIKNNVTSFTTSIIDLNGNLSARNLIPSNADIRHDTAQIPTYTIGLDYNHSIYIKYNGNRYFLFSSLTGGIRFDFNNNTISSIKGSVINSNTEILNNGWFRISFSFTSNGGERFIFISSATIIESAFNAYLGDGVSGVLIYGAQLEQGSTATSYIPTDTTTVTRLADEISVPTPAGVTSITETIDGVEQAPITTIPATYSLPVGNINKITML